MIRRSREALTLEKILHSTTHRYLFCWNGEQGEDAVYDCACCISYLTDEDLSECDCPCHERIDAISQIPSMTLWLRAMVSMDALPPFFASEDEKVAWLEAHPCGCDGTCKDCMFLKRVRERKESDQRVLRGE